jgi:PKD repeat protein
MDSIEEYLAPSVQWTTKSTENGVSVKKTQTYTSSQVQAMYLQYRAIVTLAKQGDPNYSVNVKFNRTVSISSTTATVVGTLTVTAVSSVPTITMQSQVSISLNESGGVWRVTAIDWGDFMTGAAPPAQAPTVTLTATPNSDVAPLTVGLTATANDPDGSIASYIWEFGDGQSAVGSPAINHTYNTPGNYTVQVTVFDNSGMSATASSNITVSQANRPPVVSISADATSGGTPFYVGFDVKYSDPDGNVFSCNLDFGDGTSTSTFPARHSYKNPGIYTATATAMDMNSVTTSRSVTITAREFIVVTEDFEDDAIALPFVDSTGGPAAYDWARDSSSAYGGGYSFSSQNAGWNYSAAVMEVNLKYPIAGDISFDYRVSSEGSSDVFCFYIDYEPKVVEVSGEQPWSRASFWVPPGQHKFIWLYEKDWDGSAGEDKAYIDNVRVRY